MPELTKSRTTAEILGETPARELLQDIFADLHPGFIDESRDVTSIFTPQSARDFLSQLTNFEKLLTESDSYDATVKKMQGQIDQAEGVRDQLLARVFEQIRPLERSYRQLMLFFENSKVPDGKVRKPVEIFVLNSDPKAMKDVFSMSVAAMENFVRKRNDNFNFRDDICNMVIPGFIPQGVREKFEDIANSWGMLLINDLDDEKSFKNVERNFLPGGKYEFLKRPEDRAAADVVTMGYLQLRPAHWFEKKVEGGDDLYGAPSLVFAGAVARADDSQGIAQGPVGSRFGQVAGSEKCRIEPLIGEMEHLSMERQLVPIIRDADNHLCFFGCRTQADDPYGVLKFFTSYRILRYLERCCRHYLLQVAGQVLTRDFMDEQLKSSLTGASITVDDSPKGQLGTDGIQVDALAQGTHSLVLGTPTGPRKVSFQVGPAPALDAIVFSDRDVGSVLVTTGQDDTDIFLDGKPYPRKTQSGQLRIPNLKTQQHTIRVHKEGFQDPADQTVAISKGQEAALRFTLVALPKMATLSLDHLPQGTQIALDDAPLGQVNPDGSLSHPGVSPGQHTVSFAIPGYLTQKVTRKFSAGDVIRMSTADVELKRSQGVLDVTAAGNVSVTIEQNGHAVRQFTGASKLSLDEGSYTVIGRGPSGVTGSTTVSLASGETKSVNVRLSAAANAMDRWDHPEKWKLEDGWYGQRGGGFVLYQVPPGPASYVFALRWRHGHSPFSSGGRLRWVLAYLDDHNYIEMQVDGKYLYRSEVINGTRHEEPKLEHHIPDNIPFVTFSVDVAPATLVQRFSVPNGPWQMMDTWDRQKGPSLYAGKTRGFTDGKFGFLIPADRGLEMSNFAYYPKTK